MSRTLNFCEHLLSQGRRFHQLGQRSSPEVLLAYLYQVHSGLDRFLNQPKDRRGSQSQAVGDVAELEAWRHETQTSMCKG